MSNTEPDIDFDLSSVWKKVQGKLKEHGIDVDFASDGPKIKVVCVTRAVFTSTSGAAMRTISRAGCRSS